MDKQAAKRMFSSCDFNGNYKFYKTVKKSMKEKEFICMGFTDILISTHGNVFEFSYFNKINLYEVKYLIPEDIDVMFIKSLRDTMKIVNMLKSLNKYLIFYLYKCS
jgi:superfamily II DNA/RNA helicase